MRASRVVVHAKNDLAGFGVYFDSLHERSDDFSSSLPVN